MPQLVHPQDVRHSGDRPRAVRRKALGKFGWPAACTRGSPCAPKALRRHHPRPRRLRRRVATRRFLGDRVRSRLSRASRHPPRNPADVVPRRHARLAGRRVGSDRSRGVRFRRGHGTSSTSTSRLCWWPASRFGRRRARVIPSVPSCGRSTNAARGSWSLARMGALASPGSSLEASRRTFFVARPYR